MLTFDDVLLVPQESDVKSREDVLLFNGRLELDLPVISANMDRVTGAKMALAMQKAGGLGIIHRFMDLPQLKQEIATFYQANGRTFDEGGKLAPYDLESQAYNNLALSVGVNSEKQFIDTALKYARIVCVDVAHGHNSRVRELCQYISHRSPFTVLIAGNVATPDGVEYLAKSKVDIVKVGVGPGSLCSTRLMTGHGIPQLTAIARCAEQAAKHKIEIIGDGGIRTPGDAAKAFAAGATYIMVGNMLAGTDEAPGEIIEKYESDNLGNRLLKKYKEYRGMASVDAQLSIGKRADKIVPEGVSTLVPAKGPVANILYQLAGGLRSAFSYTGAHTMKEFQERAQMVRVTSAVQIENHPHGLNK